MNLEYHENFAYPKIDIKDKNPFYASILLDDYASNLSEECAVHQYLYQAFLHQEKYPEFSNALYGVAKVEMTHLRLLGEAISKLGLEPKFGCINAKDQAFIYWSADDIDYEPDIILALKKNIKEEIDAIKKYQLHISMIDDTMIQSLLKRIILDEKKHIQVFLSLLKKYQSVD